jgi:hypothetical protein
MQDQSRKLEIASASHDRAISHPPPEPDDPFAVIDKIRAAFADVPDEEIEAETARIIAEVRSEMRAERERPVGVSG